jgi:hypothetical protein
MSINFRAFDTGLRIAPGLSSDPITGKLGEIYWNTTKNNLRICVDESPVTWYDLFIQPGTAQDASLAWDAVSYSWKENVLLLLNGSTIYTPITAIPTDLSLLPGDSSGVGEFGGSVKIKGGSGLAGQGSLYVDVLAVTPEPVSVGPGSILNINAGTTTAAAELGGDLNLGAGNGPLGLGDINLTSYDITGTASNSIDLSAFANAYISGNYIKLTSDSIGLNALGTTDPTGLFTGDIYYNTTDNRFRKWDGSGWYWWDVNSHNIPKVSIDLYDNTVLFLPITTATTIDGVTVTDGMIVLVPLASPQLFQASVSGISIVWTSVALGVNPSGLPAGGDQVYILSGATNAGNSYFYNSNLSVWQAMGLPQGISIDNILRYNGSSWVVDTLTSVNGLGSIYLKDDTVIDSSPAASMFLQAANKTAGTGDGGDVFIQSGSSVGGLDGAIITQGSFLRLPSQFSLPAIGSGNTLWYSDISQLSGPYVSNGITYNRFDSADVNGEITGFSDLSQSSVTFTTGTRELTLVVPLLATYYIQGQQTDLIADAVLVLPSTSGLYYVYMDVSGTLQQTSTYNPKTLISSNALVAIVYYDDVTPGQSTSIDARNLVTVDWANREYIRQVNTLAPAGFGFTLSNLAPDGTSNSDYQFTLAAGTLRTPDRSYVISSANVASSQVSTANNLATADYILNAATTEPVIVDVGVPQWNQLSGTWSLQPVTDGYYYNYWVVGLRSQANQIVSIAGQSEHADPYGAFAEKWADVLVPGFDKTELEPLYRITYRYDSTYTNGAASVIVQVECLFDTMTLGTTITSLAGIINQNQNMVMSGGGTLTYTGTTLAWSAPAYINVPGVPQNHNTVSAGSVALASEGDVAYVVINRTGTGPVSLSVLTGNLASLLYTGAGSNLIYVIAQKLDSKVFFGGRKAMTQVTLTDNTTNGTLLTIPSTVQSVKLDYSVVRASTLETGTLWVTGGASPGIAGTSASSGDIGTDFNAFVSGPNLLLRYTTTSTGSNGTMKFSFESWDY